MKGIKNGVVFITGGENGLGADVAKTFAEENAKVVIFGIDEENGQKVASECNAITEGAMFIKGDVTSSSDLAKAMNIVKEKYGKLDFAVNNAGINGRMYSLEETPEDLYDKIMDVNVKGVFLSMQAEVRLMKENDFGKIVNIASEVSFCAIPGISAYVGSKYAVDGMTKAAALDFAKTGININAVAPGTMLTPLVKKTYSEEERASFAAMRPSNRLVNTENVAAACLYLCSDYAKDCIGSVLSVDGGYVAQ